MKKLTRTAVVVGLIAALVIAGVAALPGIVALNQVKGEIAGALSQATGRPVTIGKLGLSLFPWLGIRLTEATLGNAPGFGQAPFAHVDTALVEVRILPLFARHIVLRRIVLTGLQLNLQENQAGQTNWSMGPHLKSTRPHTPISPREAHEAPAFALLRAAGLIVKNARIQYQNARTGSHDALTHLTVRVGVIVPGQPVAVNLAGILTAGHYPVPFRIATHIDRKGTNYALDPLRLSVATLRATGVVHAMLGKPGFVASGNLHVPTFAPRPLLAALGLHYVPQDPQALKTASADVTFKVSPSQILLAPLRLTVDHTIITGDVTRDSFPLLYRVHLGINALAPIHDLPAPEAAPKAPVGNMTPTPVSVPSPLARLPLVGVVTIGSLRVHGLTMTDVRAPIHSRAGRIQVQPLTMDLYGGTFSGALVAHTVNHPLSWRVQADLQHVHVGAALRALHLFQEFSGSLDAQAALAGTGTTLAPIEQSLSGTLSGSVQHGSLRGLDLDFIANNPTGAAGVQHPKQAEGTAFSHLHASATVASGVVHMQQLSMRTSKAVVRGHGTVALPTKTVNYLLNVALAGGLTVPVRVRGPVGHIRISVSLNQLLSHPQRNGVAPALNKLGGRLKRLFGIH
ncbi:MAG: AsmA family protein [Acidiferrobacter sp.]